MYSCGIKKDDNTFNINDLGLTKKELKTKGFKPVKGDLSIYSKVRKDTTVNLGFNRHGLSTVKEWVINLPVMDYNLVGSFLNKKQIFTHTSVNYFKENKGYFFVAIGQLDNRIYICKVLRDKGENNVRLFVTTTKPYTNKQIEENLNYFNDIYEKGLSPSIIFSEVFF
jgi:hypothetical protein